MTTYEKCKQVRRIIMNRAAEVMSYQNWSNDFAAETIKEIPCSLSKTEGGRELLGLNPCDLTKDQMIDLGFSRWSGETPMMLIPLWMLPFIADEFDGEDISGEKKTMKKSEMDNDNRFGCLAYGVIPLDYK